MAAIVANTGSNNWNTNGAWVGSVQPTNADDVTIPATAVVTIPTGTTVVCNGLTISASGTLVFASTSAELDIGSSAAATSNIALSISSSATVTLTGIGTIKFVGTNTTVQTVTTGGRTLPTVNFSGVGGKWQLQDGLTSTGSLSLTAGTLDTNGQTCSFTFFQLSGSGVRTLTMGSSSLTFNSSLSLANATTTNLTVTANTATMTFNAATVSMNNGSFNMNGASLVLSGSGIATITNGGTWANVTRTGTAVKTDSLVISTTNLTCTTAFICNGQSLVNRVLISSNTVGTSRTITAASVTLTNTDFMDITGAGAATWSGTSIGDALGNTNISFTVNSGTSNGGNGVNRYWVGNVGNGSDTTHWSTTSGGTSGATVPLPQDDIFLDANSFSTTGQRVSFDMPRLCRNLDSTGCNQTGTTMGSTSGLSNSIYGNLKFAGTCNCDANATGGWVFSGRGSQTITSNGTTNQGPPIFAAPGGTYTLQDDWQTPAGSRTITFNNGTFDANGHNVSNSVYAIAATMTAVKMGSGTWSITRGTAGGSWQMLAAASVLQSQTSTLAFTGLPNGTQTFTGGGATYNILTYTAAGSTGTLLITGSNYFDTINFSDSTNARTLTFTITTLQIVRVFNVFGTSGKLMTVNSSTGGTPAFLSIVGAPSTCDWLSVQDIFASEPYKFYVGSNTTSVSGNTNLNVGTAASAPYIRFSNYLNTSGAAPTISAPFSLSAAVGNLVVLQYFWATSPGTVTPPSGFTQTQVINSGTGGAFQQVFYKTAVGGETSWATSTTNAPGIVGVRVMVIGGWVGTPTLDVTDNNNSGASSVTTLSTGSGVSNTTSLGIAVATWVENGFTGATSFSNSFEESRILAQSANTLSALLPLTSTASRSSTAIWTSAHIASSQLAAFKDVTTTTSTSSTLLMTGVA